MLTSQPTDHRLRDAPLQTAGAAAAGNCRRHQDGVDRHPPPPADPRVIAFVGKGGSGKTTTAVNLACLARRQGLRVGIVDVDPQRSSFQWRRCRNTDDIPARPCSPDQLGDVLALARKVKLDPVFVDLPPDSAQALAAARVADFVLVLARPTFLDLAATRTHVNLLQSAAIPHAVLLNAAPPCRQGLEAPMVRDAREAILDFTKRLWRGQITQRHIVPYATAAGRGVIEIDRDGPAAAEYGALWSAVVRQTQIIRRS